jgi:3' exoribonuclease, RNase T-like
MRNYCLDVETLGTESTAVILSIAYIPFSFDEKPVYDELIERAKFYKLKVSDQISNYKRTTDKGTIEWWAKQSQLAREKSFDKSKYDLDAKTALDLIREDLNIKSNLFDNKDIVFWTRGSLDQCTLDSLSKQTHGDMLIPFNAYRDIRTAIDLLYDSSVGGYCSVPGFNRDIVLKHDPAADCAYDIMQLLSGNLE